MRKLMETEQAGDACTPEQRAALLSALVTEHFAVQTQRAVESSEAGRETGAQGGTEVPQPRLTSIPAPTRAGRARAYRLPRPARRDTACDPVSTRPR